jgi:hypothetical protein
MASHTGPRIQWCYQRCNHAPLQHRRVPVLLRCCVSSPDTCRWLIDAKCILPSHTCWRLIAETIAVPTSLGLLQLLLLCTCVWSTCTSQRSQGWWVCISVSAVQPATSLWFVEACWLELTVKAKPTAWWWGPSGRCFTGKTIILQV